MRLFDVALPPVLAGSALWTRPVLLLDAQATGTRPSRGALVEIGWAAAPASRAGSLTAEDVRADVLAIAGGLPPAVARLTGLSRADLAAGRDPASAWRALEADARALGEADATGPVPAVVHFASFEEPFLRDLCARHGRGGAFPLHLVCTHAIAKRLLPQLPRRTLRALTGYFGRSVPPLRRSADHVLATGLVWQQLVRLLAEQGLSTFGDLERFLEEPAPRAVRTYPMPRARRLGVPDAPGVYRLLRANGDVLYVGKALSLRRRVNSHFRGHAGRGERSLEMLTQAFDLSVTCTETALEAALLEADEIKRFRPPYNVALSAAGRAAWFSSADFRSLRERADDRHPVGPFASPLGPRALAALMEVLGGAAPEAVLRGACLGVEPRWAPDAGRFAAGLARFQAGLPSLVPGAGARELLRAGAALWRERLREGAVPEAEDEEVLTPPEAARWGAAEVDEGLRESLRRAAHAVRRARWLCRLSEASLCWTEPRGRRWLVLQAGEVVRRGWMAGDAPLLPPPGHARTMVERRAAFDVSTLDRVRVLGTELRRVVGESPAVELKLGPFAVLGRGRLQRVLAWV